LNEEALEFAVNGLIEEIDYDLWKYVRHDEETGEDNLPHWVDVFRGYYEAYLEVDDD
jgi:hypothetical protein